MAADASNLAALQGTMEVFIRKGELGAAKDHMEFMLTSAEAVGVSPQLIFLQVLLLSVGGGLEALAPSRPTRHPRIVCAQALLAWRADKNRDKHVELLVKCKKRQMQLLAESKTPKNSFDWFVAFNPSLLLRVCEELLLHCGVTPLTATESVPRALKEAKSLLEMIAMHLEGSLHAKLLLARCQFISGQFDETKVGVFCCPQST